MKNKDTGFLGENMTALYLIEKGYTILTRNWRYRHLEIDIIASFANRLHIVEVKTRSTLEFGFPEQMINAKKMQFLKNAAAHYQYQNPHWQWIQFDIAAVYKCAEGQWKLDYFEDVYF